MKILQSLVLAGAGFALLAAAPTSAFAQAEPYLGQVSLFATNWCPKNWAQANGAILSIQQNSALFSLYGTTYGGNGTSTFALPNLVGRVPQSFSSTNPIGSAFGATSVTLTQSQMPMHTHMVLASSTAPATNDPSGGALATFPAGNNIYAANTATPDVPMNPGVVSPSGGNQPVSIQNPVLAMNWCVAMSGIYPSRS